MAMMPRYYIGSFQLQTNVFCFATTSISETKWMHPARPGYWQVYLNLLETDSMVKQKVSFELVHTNCQENHGEFQSPIQGPIVEEYFGVFAPTRYEVNWWFNQPTVGYQPSLLTGLFEDGLGCMTSWKAYSAMPLVENNEITMVIVRFHN
jgi:hypothetical protein